MNILVMPKKNREEVSLAKLANEINARHALVQKSARRGLVNIIKTGILLKRVKRQVGHGNFKTWIAASCTFKPRTAQLYMFVASNKKQIKSEIIAGFGLNGAVKQIRERNDPLKLKNKSEKKDKDPDLQKELITLNKSLVTPRRIIQRVEKKQGWSFWRRENTGMLKRIEENAVALTTLLSKRFSRKSRSKSK